MKVRGVRGAITADANTPDAIFEATRVLMLALIEANQIEEEDVASVLFSTTTDLTAAFPARAARDIGWRTTALMGCQEMDVPGSVERCIRVLIHWNTDLPIQAIQHRFMRGAAVLRPDLTENAE